jgi:branched-chain amino acid transport system ATP-binding protein
MLEIKGLSKHFGGVGVIEGLDLTVEGGEILGILGPNGAGKSTLFNLITGVLQPNGGTILYQSRDITRLRAWDRCRAGIGRTYQIPKPFRHMTVFENVLVAALHGGGLPLGKARAEAESVLELTGLAAHYRLNAGQLSLLDLKRLELAKSLAQRPRLLLLDEVAGGLTDAECDLLLDIVRKVHAGGGTIIWIEHVVRALRQLATRMALLYGGSIFASGTPDEVLADPRVKEVYLGA